MADPVTTTAAPGMTSIISGLFQSFKDPRTPYLLTGVLCVACLSYMAQIPNASDSFSQMFLPVAGIFSFLCVLCFFVKKTESAEDKKTTSNEDRSKTGDEVKPEPAGERKGNKKEKKEESGAQRDATPAGEEQAGEAQEAKSREINDLEEQFKFSRSFCLAAGIFSITYLFATVIEPVDPDGPGLLPRLFGLASAQFQNPGEKGTLFWIAYDVCLVHISIFVFYVALKSVREAGVIHIPLFQITLFTAAILVGFVMTTASIHDQREWIFSCKNDIVVSSNLSQRAIRPFFSCDEKLIETKVAKIRARESSDEVTPVISVLKTEILSPPKVTYWYFLFHLIIFEIFWVYRLVRIVRFSFSLIILDGDST